MAYLHKMLVVYELLHLLGAKACVAFGAAVQSAVSRIAAFLAAVLNHVVLNTLAGLRVLSGMN
jgi:hypothetical protein